MGATVVFMVADSVVWLFVARGIQGLATGLALGAASAALLDLHPRRDPAGVGLTNGVVSAGGMGLGVLVSATFVELLPAPRVLPYVVLFVLFAIAFVGRRADARAGRPPLAPAADAAAPERPDRRPRPVRARRARGDLVVVGRRPVPLARPAALGDPVPHERPPRRGPQRLRARRLRARPRSSCSAAPRRGSAPPPARSRWRRACCSSSSRRRPSRARVYIAGAVIGGAGFGVAFLGALRALSAAIPPAHRAEVMSAFYVVAYAALSLPAILAGVVVTPLGLEPTFELFGAVIAGLALVVAVDGAPHPAAAPAPRGDRFAVVRPA